MLPGVSRPLAAILPGVWRRTRPVIACLLVMSAAACAAQPAACDARLPAVSATLVTESASHGLRLEVADDDEERRQGLAGRSALADDCGMLFSYPADVRNGYWMRGTRIALDLAFIDASGRVTEVTTLQPCRADPCPTFTPTDPYRMVLEVRAGLLGELGAGAGSRLTVAEEPAPR